MRLSFIFIFAALMQVSASTRAQKVTLIQNNARLTTVLDEIRKQTGYDFVYSDKVMNSAKRVSLNLKNTELQEALEICFKDQPLSFKVEDKMVIIKPKEEPSFIENIIARFQAIDVRGKVVDSLGVGLAGATVSVKGGKESTSTSANGDFYLKNVEEGAVLVVTYMGYITKEQAINTDFIYVTLQQSTSKLDEIQIMAYGVTSKRLSTGSIFTVKSSDIEKQPVDNPLYTLMGRIPNLIITPTSGNPGAPIKVQLRGQNSLTGLQTEPLFVIDGVPYNNNIVGAFSTAASLSALSFINPSNIESIDVLTDADATAIYGSRGGSGVILITTKKGKSGAARIDISASTGYSDITKKLDLLNTQQYLDLRREAFATNNRGITPQISNEYEPGYAPDLLLWDQYRYTDWQETLLGGNARQYETKASISGGSPLIQYLIAGSYYRNGYLTVGDSKDERGNAFLNLTGTSPNQKLRANITSNYTVSNRFAPNTNHLASLALSLAPNAPSIFKDNGELNWEPNMGFAGLGTWENPYAKLATTNETRTVLTNSAADISYKLDSKLAIKANVGFTEIRLHGLSLEPLAAIDPARQSSSTAMANYTNNKSQTWTVEPQILFNENLFKGKLDVLLGASLQSNVNDVELVGFGGYNSDAYLKNMSFAAYSYGYNTSSEYRYSAIFSRLTYNWMDKYLLNLSARRDGSSRFGTRRQFGDFWSVGGAWVFSNEKLIQNLIPYLSFGKLRANYGKSGNDNIGDYAYIELYESQSEGLEIPYQGLPPIKTRGATNPDYGWEDIRKSEIALDLGFLKDNIIVTGAIWRTKSSNQLGSYPLPATAGASSLVINQPAVIQNSGADFTIRAVNIKTKKFSWITSGNFGLQRNKLVKLPEGFGGNMGELIQYFQQANIDPIGKPFYGAIPVYEFKGVNPGTGLYQFLDQEGNVSINPNNSYRGKIVTLTPKFSGGLSNAFTYGDLSVEFFLQVTKQVGYNYLYEDIFRGLGSWHISGQFGNLPAAYLNHWQNVGDITAIRKLMLERYQDGTLDGLEEKLNKSDAAFEDASFIRLKNLALSYSLPERLKQKLRLQNARIFIQAQNLWTITGYRGLDPEIQSVSAIPSLRTISAGFQLGF